MYRHIYIVSGYVINRFFIFFKYFLLLCWRVSWFIWWAFCLYFTVIMFMNKTSFILLIFFILLKINNASSIISIPPTIFLKLNILFIFIIFILIIHYIYSIKKLFFYLVNKKIVKYKNNFIYKSVYKHYIYEFYSVLFLCFLVELSSVDSDILSWSPG